MRRLKYLYGNDYIQALSQFADDELWDWKAKKGHGGFYGPIWNADKCLKKWDEENWKRMKTSEEEKQKIYEFFLLEKYVFDITETDWYKLQNYVKQPIKSKTKPLF